MSANGTPGEGETNEEADNEQPEDDYLIDNSAERAGDGIRWGADKVASGVEAAPTKARDGLEFATQGERTVPGAAKKTAYVTGKAAFLTVAVPAAITYRTGKAVAGWTRDRVVNGANRARARAELAAAAGNEFMANRHREKARTLEEQAEATRDEKYQEASSVQQAGREEADAVIDDTESVAEGVLEDLQDEYDKVDLSGEEEEELVEDLTEFIESNFSEEQAEKIIEENEVLAAKIRSAGEREAAEIKEQAHAREEKAYNYDKKREKWAEAAREHHPTMDAEADTAEAAGVATTSEGTTAAPGEPSGEDEREDLNDRIETEGSQAQDESTVDESKFDLRERLEDDESETEAESEAEDETEAETTDGGNSLFD